MKAYNEHTVDGVAQSKCTDCGGAVAVTGTWGQPSATCRNEACGSVKYFCMSCLEVVTVEVHKHFKSTSTCALCGHTNCVPHSLAEVASKYPGYLAREIIDARSTCKESESVRDNAVDSGSADAGGAPGSPVAEQSNAVGGA